MSKSWKSLFVKADEPEEKKTSLKQDAFSFPVTNFQDTSNNPILAKDSQPVSAAVNEVIEVYERGLDSINMPGYDFYEFYKTIMSAGINSGEQAYNMAFQMAKTLDNTVSSQKLLKDAEFYLSKINEVHGQYAGQGQQKLNAIQNDKITAKSKLSSDIDAANRRMMDLRNELQSLELNIKNKQEDLSKIDTSYFPQEQAIREKLNANDLAHSESISKLNRVKEGIKQLIKN
jgi:hypothetical protein